MNLCKKQGYHIWDGQIESSGEDYEEMTITATCKRCGAEFEATGDWDNDE